MPSLTEFIAANRDCLSRETRQRMKPLYDPEVDQPHPAIAELLRTPKNPQQHIITGMARHLDRDKVGYFGMSMGTGKTYTALATAHVRNHGRPYCCLVVCPPTLVNKWEREIKETIPGAVVIHAQTWQEWLLLASVLKRKNLVGATFIITPLSKAKLGARRMPAASTHRRSGALSCPQCFAELFRPDRESPGCHLQVTWDWLEKKKRYCTECGSALWQSRGTGYKASIIIKKKLKGFFDIGIMDEQHLMKSKSSQAGEAFSHFVLACKKVLILTGTLISGRSSDLRPTLFRCQAHKLKSMGIGYHDINEFQDRYGRRQTTEISRLQDKGGVNIWKKNHKVTTIQPGITPEFYRDFMAECAVFLGLEDMASDDMPPLTEEMVAVSMTPEMQAAYELFKQKAKEIYVRMRPEDEDAARNWGHIAHEFLLNWPDCPSGWDTIKYIDEYGDEAEAFTPPDFGMTPTPKELRLIEIIKGERDAGRQVWVYSNRNRISERLHTILRDSGLAVSRLLGTTDPADREQWIQQHGPGSDVVISHPQLVEVGIDLFGKAAGKYGQPYNFCTLIHY